MSKNKEARPISQSTRLLFLFSFGLILYMLIEIGFRGYTHWSMGLLGGTCFLLIGGINEVFTYDIPLIVQGVIGSICITILEFIVGLIFNIWLGMGIWDYSNQWGNILGQICPLFSFIWIFISCLAIWIDDLLRYFLFKEEFPHYRIF